jgi:hypothetical protein
LKILKILFLVALAVPEEEIVEKSNNSTRWELRDEVGAFSM